MRLLILALSILVTSCGSFTQMQKTLDHSTAVIEKNTQKMEESGLVIEENTREIREYTISMKFAFPIFCLFILLLNYYFYNKVIKRLDNLK